MVTATQHKVFEMSKRSSMFPALIQDHENNKKLVVYSIEDFSKVISFSIVKTSLICKICLCELDLRYKIVTEHDACELCNLDNLPEFSIKEVEKVLKNLYKQIPNS